MHRAVYRLKSQVATCFETAAALKAKTEALQRRVAGGEIMTASVFRHGLDFFAYYECLGDQIPPEDLFGDLTRLAQGWPGEAAPQAWAPMADIYHGAEPVSVGYWVRRGPVQALGQVNRLRWDKVASYVFYHYQYQEEKPGDWAKYAAIYLQDNYLFFYQEEPDGPAVTPYPGRLETANTPDGWQELMLEHFLPWDDDPALARPWRPAETVLSVWPVLE
ncbi:MAG: hypothetical protein LBR19_09995 [Bifidobacteriaceae bacterium]|jgi:hypothetical protein|nr:hypothetical protein [Bifidobacteriaceae bacterium]